MYLKQGCGVAAELSAGFHSNRCHRISLHCGRGLGACIASQVQQPHTTQVWPWMFTLPTLVHAANLVQQPAAMHRTITLPADSHTSSVHCADWPHRSPPTPGMPPVCRAAPLAAQQQQWQPTSVQQRWGQTLAAASGSPPTSVAWWASSPAMGGCRGMASSPTPRPWML